MVVLVSFSLALFLVYSTWTDWRGEQVVFSNILILIIIIILAIIVLQVITTLKNTALSITALDFPTVTICASGFHMNNVEKAVGENFAKWRKSENRSEGDSVLQDMIDYMEQTFQIRPRKHPVNILDILDTMVASNVEASLAANGVRENVLACQDIPSFISTTTTTTTTTTTLTPTTTPNNPKWKECCQNIEISLKVAVGIGEYSWHKEFDGNYTLTQIVSLDNIIYTKTNLKRYLTIKRENNKIWFRTTCPVGNIWGCYDDDRAVQITDLFKGYVEDNITHPLNLCTNREVPDLYEYNLWFGSLKERTGKWQTVTKSELSITCMDPGSPANNEQVRLAAEKAAVNEIVNKRTCIETTEVLLPSRETSAEIHQSLPGVDIFLNPLKKTEMDEIVTTKQSIAKSYFRTSDMSLLYPALFRILWESTLPCFEPARGGEHMLTSCQIAGRKINCSEIFTRMPTDSGMCCTLNSEEALRASEYQKLVKEMQGTGAVKKVEAQVGKKNGLKLTLDLHSNLVSFGTLDQDFDAFNIFIGRPAEFPVLKERGLQLEPGHEHWIDLSASVVTSSEGVRNIDTQARNCYYSDEGNLTFYQEYTFTNCRLECAILKVEKRLGCIPWFLPKVKFFEGSVKPSRVPTLPRATHGQLESFPPSSGRCRAGRLPCADIVSRIVN